MNPKSTPRFLLGGFLYILVFPLITRRIRGEENGEFNLEEYLLSYYLNDNIKDEYDPPVMDTVTLNDNNNDYPYEQLLKFVKETKRILQSPYDERKTILQRNFGRHYTAYLKGDNSDVPCPNPARFCPPMPALGLVPPPPSPPLEALPPLVIPQLLPRPFATPSIPPSSIPYRPGMGFGGSAFNNTIATASAESDRPRAPVPVSGPADSGGMSGKPEINPCEQIVRLVRPKRLKSVDGKEHFILNLGNEFVQEIKIVQCSRYQGQCGDQSLWPDTFEKVCEQTYNSYKTLFSVPVNKEINILDQNLHVFEVSSGCNCKLRKRYR